MAFIDVEGEFDKLGKVPDGRKFSGVIELAAAVVHWPTLRVIHVFHSFVRPVGTVNYFPTLNVHGLAFGFLKHMPSWESVQRSFAQCLKEHHVRFIVGVGRDIFDLMSSVPGVPVFQYWDLALPIWRERASTNYTTVHGHLWTEYSLSRFAQCADAKHAAYKPPAKYRNKKKHKVWYGVHCALKDVWYMVAAVHLGVEIKPYNNT